MNKRKNEDKDNIAGTSKLQRTNDETNSKIAFDQNPSPDIFKLHAIVCFELFEYLSLKDIHSMGQTCKRMNRIAGNYFQDNYSADDIDFQNGDIHFNDIQISGFSQYVNKIWIHVRELEPFKYFGANFKSIKKIILDGFNGKINKAKVECIQGTLGKIESIQLSLEVLNCDDFYEQILKYCLNIKSIIIGPFTSVDASWLHQKYPTLEHLYFYGNIATETKDDWKVFIEQNPNIRSFECRADFLVANEDWLLTTNATFDYLTIKHSGKVNTNRVCSLVKKLYERGFYKKLRLEFVYLEQNVFDVMCKLPAIERLTHSSIFQMVDFPVMTDVKELYSHGCDIDMESIMNCKFPNVERIELYELELNQLFVLIGRLKKLKELRLRCYYIDNIGLLNLWALNKERAKLTGAGKVTIYVKDKIFLASKWANNNRDFELIEIKRYDSCPHDFEFN